MASFQVQTTTHNGKPVVYLTVGGFRFTLEAPTGERARQIAIEVARTLGLNLTPEV